MKLFNQNFSEIKKENNKKPTSLHDKICEDQKSDENK